MDSIVSPKVKKTEGERIGVHSLAHNTSGVEGRAGALGWGLGRLTSKSITHTDLHKLNNKLVNAQLEHFSARTSHGQTRTHKIHHDTDLGESTTFLLIIYYVPGHETSTQMSFCFRIPKWKYRNFHNWVSHDFEGP